MKRSTKWLIAAAIGIAAAGGTAAWAYQGDESAELRATGMVGEQADGYLGLVGSGSPEIRARMDAVNIQRRAFYTQRASARGATIEEFAASTACEIFARRVLAGQYYRLPDGVWRRRNGSEPVPLPGHCG
ncbi:MAG: YdbL family protein [Sphingosinicella sp.]